MSGDITFALLAYLHQFYSDFECHFGLVEMVEVVDVFSLF